MSRIARSLASHLDLNDLDALAATCRTVHENLCQYVQQLKAQSLRCIHDSPMTNEWTSAAHTAAFHAEEPVIDVSIYSTLSTLRPQTHSVRFPATTSSSDMPLPGRLSNKSNTCARDLVSPCRKCDTVVCRNCTVKPPTNAWLRDRYRRLCKTCLDAPFEAHLQPLCTPNAGHEGAPLSSASSAQSDCSYSSASSASCDFEEACQATRGTQPSFTSPAFLRSACMCMSRGVFLCVQCGLNLRAADTTYKRVWTWRSRYSTHIGGGLGTGLGQGNQGQKCGRGEDCLESSADAVCWLEIDCAETNPRGQRQDDGAGTPPRRGETAERKNNTPGYFQQEIEGIGGVVKKKVKKKVKVGATVWEFEDERASGKYLEREAEGVLRSWCGWCGRVCPGEEDVKAPLKDVVSTQM